MATHRNLVNLKDVTHGYGSRTVLRDVTLGVAAGERIGIVGRNGDGKSTLMRLVAGVEEPDAGQVTRAGDVDLALLAQGDELDEHRTLRDALVGARADHEWAADAAFRAWWDLAGNRAASPSMARRSSQALLEGDVREQLSLITAPTLILHRSDARFVGVDHGRYLAEHIAGSRYVELPGADTIYWVGETTAVLDEIEEFITGVRGASDAERVLTTIVFTDIVGSTERAAELGDDRWHALLDNHDNVVRRQLDRFRGLEVNTVGDGFVAIFPSPSTAIDCADAIVDAVRPLRIEVRVGIHAGEVEVRGDDIARMAVHIGARVAALAGPSEVLVSSTVREIVTGSRRQFIERGEYELKGVPGRWRVHALVRDSAVVGR